MCADAWPAAPGVNRLGDIAYYFTDPFVDAGAMPGQDGAEHGGGIAADLFAESCGCGS
jgi:hypothetical protein